MAPKANSGTTTDRADPRTIYFDPLDETNYHYWVMRMEAELIRRDLWSVIALEEDLEGKTKEEVEAAQLQWITKRSAKKMAEARSEIVARVSDSQLDHFLTLKDPMKIWETLAGIHVARGLATRLALRRKFLRLVKEGDETMSAWIGRVKRMAFQLVAIGVDVSDEDRILALTNGLDDSYEAFVISLDATQPQNLTLEYVVDRLLNDEMRRDNKGVKSEEDEIKVKREAYLSKGSGSGSSSTSRMCWHCGKAGHIKTYCPEIASSSEKEKYKDSKGKKKEDSEKSQERTNFVSQSVSQLRDLGSRVVGQLI